MADRTERLVERLFDLTTEGELDWRPQYNRPEIASIDDETMQAASTPAAYILIDSDYGFGVASFTVESRYGGAVEDGSLFVAGEHLSLTLAQVRDLRDAIKVYLDDVRLGDKGTPQDRMEERVQEAVEPYMEKIQQLRAQIQRLNDMNTRLLAVTENLSKTESKETRAPTPPEIPLNANTFRHALYLFAKSSSDVAWELVDEGLSPARAESIIDDMKQTLPSDQNEFHTPPEELAP